MYILGPTVLLSAGRERTEYFCQWRTVLGHGEVKCTTSARIPRVGEPLDESYFSRSMRLAGGQVMRLKASQSSFWE